MCKAGQAGEMQFSIQGRRAINGDKDCKAAHEGGPGRTVTAQVGCNAGDDQLSGVALL